MAQSKVIVYEILDSDSDSEEMIPLPPPILLIIEDDSNRNREDEIQMEIINNLFGTLQRVQHIRIKNYVENIVTKYNNADFIMHFRLSRGVANDLINRFRVSETFISIADRVEEFKISPEKHILCYLWFVGHETSCYRDVADRFGLSISALYSLITRVTNFILSLAPNIIKYPNRAEKEKTANYFLTKTGFPGVIGAIDGSHIRIDKPIEDPDSYVNRKQYFSLHMQGTVNEDLKFIDVFIGYPGSVHDARVFKNSYIYNDLPGLCGDEYVLLGDSAYPCLKYLMVPYKDNGHLTRSQKKYNEKLSSCRVVVENAFGCLKQRFRQLYHFKLRNIPRMVRVIHACCVLHNMANLVDLQILEAPINDSEVDVRASHIINNEVPRIQETGNTKRNDICNAINSA